MFRNVKSLSLSSSVLLCLASAAYGQATRTWVSGVGDDANPCSRTAPCKTFAGAISKTAAGGEINVIDSAGYGAVTITKSIRIDGSPFLSGILVSGSTAITINAAATDQIVLKGLTIDGFNTAGTSRGVNFLQGGSLTIDQCDIFGFGQRGVSFTPANDGAKLIITNSNIYNNASNGIVIQPTLTARAALNNVNVSKNTNFGISITSNSNVTVQDSVITNNGLSGMRIDGGAGATAVDLQRVMISGNATGLETLTGSTTRVSGSSIVQNTTGILAGGSIQSAGNNNLVGNTGGNAGMSLIGQQ